MITNDGREIISKYLLGQVEEYATHLAIGCGAAPLGVGDQIPNYLYDKKRLDFEMTRVPISSKGFVDDSQSYSVTNKEITSGIATLTIDTPHDIEVGETIIVSISDAFFDGQYTVSNVDYINDTVSYPTSANDVVSISATGQLIVSRTKMSLTAELPTNNRYEITEVGIWSAGKNNLASQYDSRILFNFSGGWQRHGAFITDPQIISNLGDGGGTVDGDIHTDEKVFYANTDDPLFQYTERKDRKEGPRNLNRTLLVRGDLSSINIGSGIDDDWTPETDTEHIHLNNIGFDISGNSTADILKLAFSVIDRTAIADELGSNGSVKILMEFFKNEVSETNAYAKAQIYIPGTDFYANRYKVSSMEISQDSDPDNPLADTSLPYVRFYTAPDFSATDIRVCRIFVSIEGNDSLPSSDHYIAFDGFRIDNTTENPIYKMSGYSIASSNGYAIIKPENTNNYIDFRFSLGIS